MMKLLLFILMVCVAFPSSLELIARKEFGLSFGQLIKDFEVFKFFSENKELKTSKKRLIYTLF